MSIAVYSETFEQFELTTRLNPESLITHLTQASKV